MVQESCDLFFIPLASTRRSSSWSAFATFGGVGGGVMTLRPLLRPDVHRSVVPPKTVSRFDTVARLQGCVPHGAHE